MAAAADDAHLRETCIASELVYRGRLLEVRRDRVRLPGGGEAGREYIVHPGAVVIVPLLDDGRLVMERQFRYPLGRVLLEFPAGKIDAGEDPFRTGVRELAEETGYTAAEWAHAGTIHNAVGYSDERIEVWFARGLTQGSASLEEGEQLELLLVEPAALDAMCARGEVTDVKTLVGLLWLQRWRAGHWPLHWQPAPV
jgi:ADP-ribose pyrophosphatase